MRRYYLHSGLWMSVLTVLILGAYTFGGAGNQIDDGVTSGTVSGQGTKIAVEVFATSVTTSLVGVQIEFDFDASVWKAWPAI